MNGAWITKEGNIFYTSDIINHELSLIRSDLLDNIDKNIYFSNDEIKKHFDKDIRYKAFKSGLIRVVCIYNQFAIECILENLSIQSKNKILEYFEQQLLTYNIKDIVIEDATTNKSYFFQRYDDFKQFLLK